MRIPAFLLNSLLESIYRKMKRYFLYLLFIFPFFSEITPNCRAQIAPLPFHCEKDTTEVRQLIDEISKHPDMPLRGRIVAAANALLGKGADESLTTDSAATLTLNVDTFTPLSFVNTCLALAKASTSPGAGWRTYSESLKNYSCRRGENEGFPSMFYHTSDWIGDNIYRGNFIEMTDRMENAKSKNWSLDHLSVNKDKYPVLNNPEIYDRVRMIEMGFRSHKIPFLAPHNISNKNVMEDLKEGDIIVMISERDRSDFLNIGIVAMEGDGPHLIHFDPSKKCIVKEPEPMKRYFNLMAKHFTGFRWIRAL